MAFNAIFNNISIISYILKKENEYVKHYLRKETFIC